MTSILALGDLLARIERYAARRADGLIVDEEGVIAAPLQPRAATVLREAAIFGELPRNKIVEIVGMSERSARSVTKSLVDEGLFIPS